MARPQDLCEFVGAMSWKSRQITSQKAVPLCLEFILKIVEAAAGLDGGDVMVTWVRPLPLSGLGLGAERRGTGCNPGGKYRRCCHGHLHRGHRIKAGVCLLCARCYSILSLSLSLNRPNIHEEDILFILIS